MYAVEGAASEQLGQLLALADTLDKWRHFQSMPHSPDTWLTAIPELLEDFCEPDLDEAVQLQRVRDALGRWHEELQDAAFDGTLSPQVVRNWFREYLGGQGGWQRFLAGPVNFCTLMPMRSIPFRAVCLLGMNDQDYPRQVVPVGFDLITSGRARRGDRSRREDDRYLVLEALCSAQDKLYISYRGRDARENHELQPSVLISELLDYICDSYCLSDDQSQPGNVSRERIRHWLTEALPLQPFSRRSYESDRPNAVGSYHPLWAGVVNAAGAQLTEPPFFSAPLPLPDEFDASQVLWEDVKACLLKPADFFLKRRLRLSPELWSDETRNEETFVPDDLEASILRSRWLTDARLGTENLSDFTQREQALGHLPVNALGQIKAEDLSLQLSDLTARLRDLCRGEPESGTLQVQLPADGPFGMPVVCRVSGEYQNVWPQGIPGHPAGHSVAVQTRAGDIRGEHILSLWLDIVLIAAADDAPQNITSALLLGGKKELQEFGFEMPSQESARQYLAKALSHYWQSWQAPQNHLPSLHWALLTCDESKQEGVLKKDIESAYSAINRAATQRCFPQLAQQLMNDYQSWMEEHDWILRAPLNHLHSTEESGA